MIVGTTFRAPWPGGSHTAWVTAATTADPPWTPGDDCRSAPDLATAEGFRRNVRTHYSEGSLLAATFGSAVATVIVLHQITGLVPPVLQHPVWSTTLWIGAGAAASIAFAGFLLGSPSLPFGAERARARMLSAPHVLGQAYPARSSIGGRSFEVDGAETTEAAVVVLDTTLDAESSRRLLRAFDVWFGSLDRDYLSYRAAQLRFGSDSIVTSEEIFGAGATGGYLVRDPDPSIPGWRLLIAGRHDHSIDRPYRRGDVLTVPDDDVTDCETSLETTDSGHLVERIAAGVLLFAAVSGWVWFAGAAFMPGPW